MMRALADDQISVTQLGAATLSAPSPLSDSILGPITRLSAEFFPGAVVLPTMSAGATDFLAKPFDDEVLLTSVRVAMKK